MIDNHDLLKLILPEFLVENFNITKAEHYKEILHIYFEEKNNYQEEHPDIEVVSKGFFEDITVQDFPLRGKSVQLHIKRRRWKDKRNNEVVHRDWNIVAKGTRMTNEFAEFLKKISRY